MCSSLQRLGIAVVLALALAGSAQAAAPYEPNDAPESAFGPIGTAGGLHVIEAAGDTPDDEDWYSFFVPDGAHDVTIAFEQLAPDDTLCARLHTEIDGLASELVSVEADPAARQPAELSSTVEGPARALVSVDGCDEFAAPPAPYRLALAGDWPAADPRPAPEPAGPAAGPEDAGPPAPCHAAAAELRAATARLRAARRAHRRHHTRQSRRRVVAARKGSARAIRKVVRVC